MLFQNKFRIESARLKEWDYTSCAWYYVTINSKNHEIWFGNIVNDEPELNDLGKIAAEYWNNIPNHFPTIELDYYVIMPNHIHGIIILNEKLNVETPHGASQGYDVLLKNNETPDRASLQLPTLGEIINQFKGSVKRWANKNNNKNFSWQPRFYDHIIRNEKSLYAIREYIRLNPLKWSSDEYYRE